MIKQAKYLSNIARKVYVINRTEIFRMGEHKLAKVKQMKNVEILINATVEKLKGKEILESVDILMNRKKQNLKIEKIL